MEKLMDELMVMKEAAVKKTQEMLSKVITTPVLTDKLLKRPPFRYLHDIITEVIRTTGFMKDLYDENEMNSDNVQDKQSKIAFLQKAIDVVTLVSGKALAARPVYIVAGYQPEKTNELLQSIAECCLNNLPSDHAVQQVLGENKVDLKTSTSTSKEKRKKKYERILTREERKNITEHSPVTCNPPPDLPKEQQHPLRAVRVRKCSDTVKDPHQIYCVYKSEDRLQDSHKERDKDRQKAEERERDRVREKDKYPNNEQEMTRERVSSRDLDRNNKQQRRTEQKMAAASAEPEFWSKTAKLVPASDIPVRKTQPSSPATPWVKSRKANPGVTSPGRPLSPTYPVPIILDREGEDKQFVKEGAASLIPPAPNMELELSPSFQNSTEHNWLFDAAWAKEEDEVTKEVECLHSSIQKVCCSFLPLGKSMDNIQEDIEDMVAECHTWQEENKKHAQALLEEQRVTDLTLDPLKAELAEVEQLIADQLNMVYAVKSNIQKNEEKILKVVMGMNISC